MVEQIEFYGFRGNISFPDQITIYSLGIKDDAKTKNEQFCSFFSELKKFSKLESLYQKREYYFIFINQYDNIIHCQLARRRQYNKYEMNSDDRIIDTRDEDFPYVNVFIESKSQKLLIQSNTQVFENYNTCRDVIQNIMNNYFKKNDAMIIINPILREEEFWYFFDDEKNVYSLRFSLCVPNWLDASTSATNFLNGVRDNTGANHTELAFSNSEGKLKPNKKGIGSFVEYVIAGAGSWNLTYSLKEGKKMKVSSKQKSYKVAVPISINDLNNNNLDNKKIELIKEALLTIESIEKFKEK